MEHQEQTQEISIKAVGQFNTMGMKKNKSVDLSFKFPYDERLSIIKLALMVSQDIKIVAKLPGQKPCSLGYFKLYNLSIDRDGQATVKFTTLLEYADMDNINNIIDEDSLLQIKMTAAIVVEE